MRHVAGHYYHVYNRGCNREPIFANPGNYTFLLRKVKTYLSRYPLTVIVYCIMPNHYHFLLRAEADNAISPFLRRLFNGYVQAFNRQQKRSGTLFEGRARSVLVKSESHVLHLCRYIHLNPVEAKLVAQPGDWPYSNYLDWIGRRNGKLKDEAFIREYFPTPEAYQRFVAAYQEERRELEVLDKYMFD